MKIFITGGTGFIGKFVVKRLQKAGYQILVLTKKKIDPVVIFGSKKNIKLLQGNLSNIRYFQPIVRRFRPDVAIHLAWEGIPDYGLEASFKNLKHGINLIEMLGKIGCKMFVGAGSCWEYGAMTGKISEKTSPQSSTPFTSAKLALKLFGESISAEHGMKFVWLRLFYVYGPGQRPISLLPTIINGVLKGKVPEIKNIQGGNDFVYVDDIAEAIVKVVQKYKSIPEGEYNIGSGYLTGVREISNLAMEYCNVFTLFKPSRKKTAGFFADTRKIRKVIGWVPSTTIEQGVKKTINYYKSI
ncbi:NAD(P)-dependent oxidoreductase [Patescibacteria group bacterium]|nr:NAD(P)-dependent oxidoreductase [Patescibacteria group bacterium]